MNRKRIGQPNHRPTPGKRRARPPCLVAPHLALLHLRTSAERHTPHHGISYEITTLWFDSNAPATHARHDPHRPALGPLGNRKSVKTRHVADDAHFGPSAYDRASRPPAARACHRSTFWTPLRR